MAIATLGGMVKGYGETRHRTTSRLMQIWIMLSTRRSDRLLLQRFNWRYGARIKLRTGSAVTSNPEPA